MNLITKSTDSTEQETPAIPDGFPLASDFILPRNAIRKRLAVIAVQGAGKSYLTMVMIERMVEAGFPVIVIDPLGVYWGLRSSADGTGPGLSVLLLGGSHGDLPLDSGSGSLIADVLLDLRRPVVLDLSAFSNSRQQCLFVAEVLEGLHRAEKPKLHLIIDESDLFAPQMPKSPEAQRSYDAMDTLARRDRVKGLGATFLTQRPAKLAKDVLSQIDALISLRLGGPHDIKALNDWFELHATKEQMTEFKDSVTTLATGTAWIWSPSWLSVFRKVSIEGRTTYDSSATPDVDEQEVAPAHLSTINLDELGERIAVLRKASANTPEALNGRIVQLEEELRQARAGQGGGARGRNRQRETEEGTQLAQLRKAHATLTEEHRHLQQEALRLHSLLKQMEQQSPSAGDDSISPASPGTLAIGEATIERVNLQLDTEIAPLFASPDQNTIYQARIRTLEEEMARLLQRLEEQEAVIGNILVEQTMAPSLSKAPLASGLTTEQERQLDELIQHINHLERLPRLIVRSVLPFDQEVPFQEIAARLHRTREGIRTVRMGALTSISLIAKSKTGYRSLLYTYCQRQLLNAPVPAVQRRLLEAIKQ